MTLVVQVVNTPMLPTKFIYLKHLTISIGSGPSYDYSSLFSFLDVSPSLETLILDVRRSSFRPTKMSAHSVGSILFFRPSDPHISNLPWMRFFYIFWALFFLFSPCKKDLLDQASSFLDTMSLN